MTLGEAEKALIKMSAKATEEQKDAIEIARRSMEAWVKVKREIESDNMIGSIDKALVMASINKRLRGITK